MDNHTDTSNEPTLPDVDKTRDLMQKVLNHYVAHHHIVLEKLKIAQRATQKSMDDVTNLYDQIKDSSPDEQLKKIKSYDQTWEMIINLFSECGISENELFQIEGILTTLPNDIKTEFDFLLNQDNDLLALIGKLNTDEYHQAKEAIDEIQEKENPLSGLTADDYEPDEETQAESAGAFKIVIPGREE